MNSEAGYKRGQKIPPLLAIIIKKNVSRIYCLHSLFNFPDEIVAILRTCIFYGQTLETLSDLFQVVHVNTFNMTHLISLLSH